MKSTISSEQRSRVGRNDPCPCGSGRKYKKCCLDRATTPAAPGGRFSFEPGSYGGPGAHVPSVVCMKEENGLRSVHFVLVKPQADFEIADAAAEEAGQDLAEAFSSGEGQAADVARSLRAAGYVMVEEPRMAVD